MTIEIATKFLNDHHKGVFSVLDKEGAPSSSLLHYAIDEDLNIYIGTKKSFGKYAALRSDPRIYMAVLEESADPLRVADMQGKAEEIPAEETAKLYEWFQSKNPQKHYVKDAEDFVMFRIKPTTLRFMDASSGELKITDLIGRQ